MIGCNVLMATALNTSVRMGMLYAQVKKDTREVAGDI